MLGVTAILAVGFVPRMALSGSWVRSRDFVRSGSWVRFAECALPVVSRAQGTALQVTKSRRRFRWSSARLTRAEIRIWRFGAEISTPPRSWRNRPVRAPLTRPRYWGLGFVCTIWRCRGSWVRSREFVGSGSWVRSREWGVRWCWVRLVDWIGCLGMWDDLRARCCLARANSDTSNDPPRLRTSCINFLGFLEMASLAGPTEGCYSRAALLNGGASRSQRARSHNKEYWTLPRSSTNTISRIVAGW